MNYTFTKEENSENTQKVFATLAYDDEKAIPTTEYSAPEIFEQLPIVSVNMITYNHEKYIADAIEGVIQQKTDFPFELIIGDDCSTDSTLAICLDYQKRYPHIVRVITYSQNLRQNHLSNLRRVTKRCRGKYMAYCEGDDFWCDMTKLQQQVDFLEEHPDYSACFCGFYVLSEMKKSITPLGMLNGEFPTDLEAAQWSIINNEYLRTNAFLGRMDVYAEKLPLIIRDCRNAPMGDLQSFFHMAAGGKIKCIHKRMAVYRHHYGSAMSFENPVQFMERMVPALVRMLENNGLEKWIPQVQNMLKPPKKSLKAKIRNLLSPIKRFLRGDYKKYKQYLKQSPAERVRFK